MPEEMWIAGTGQQSDARFALMVRHLSDMIVIVDAQGVERYISESVEKITGYASEELLSRSGFDFLHPDDVLEMIESHQELLKHPGRTVRVEYRHRHKDGHWLNMEA